jgi:hypothetical protein
MNWTRNLKVQGRGVDIENLEKNRRMGTAEGRRKLERGRTISFGKIQMEEFQEGSMFHTGAKEGNDDEATKKI